MSKSYHVLKRDMDEACVLLRSFTLGRWGFTQGEGSTAIGRVHQLCERIENGPAPRGREEEASQAVASARSQILAAKARLALLRRRGATQGFAWLPLALPDSPRIL